MSVVDNLEYKEMGICLTHQTAIVLRKNSIRTRFCEFFA